MVNNQCDVCGNTYENLFEVRINNQSFWFDCFECAAHKLAPVCTRCHVKVLGHGIEVGEQIFCGAHCAHQLGYTKPVDHVEKVVL